MTGSDLYFPDNGRELSRTKAGEWDLNYGGARSESSTTSQGKNADGYAAAFDPDKGFVGLASLEAGDKGKEPLAVFKNPIRAAKAWYVQHTSSPRGFPFPAIFMDKVKGNRLNLIWLICS